MDQPSAFGREQNEEMREEPNVISNSEQDEEEEKDFYQAPPQSRRRPTFQPNPPGQQQNSQYERVSGADIGNIMNSKQDMYTILSTHGQFHLPSYDEVSMEFLREVFAERKKLIPLKKVVQVNVPKLSEFQTERLYKCALENPQARQHLPEPLPNGKRTVSRKFLFNVIATLSPDFFEQEIKKAYASRKEQKMMKDNKYIEFGPNMLDLVQNCNHMSSGGSKRALQLLNKGSKSGRAQQGPNNAPGFNIPPPRSSQRTSPNRSGTKSKSGFGGANFSMPGQFPGNNSGSR